MWKPLWAFYNNYEIMQQSQTQMAESDLGPVVQN